MATTKKTAKIATPIDERETFVSLKKSFAESEQEVQEKLQTLYALQEADNAIEKLVQLRGELPEEVSALEDEIDAMKAKLAHLNELIAGYNETINNFRTQIVSIDEDIEKYRSQLEGISNSREYDAINKDLENQSLMRMVAEKKINEAYAAIDARKADIEALEGRLSVREDDLLVKKEELGNIVESTAKTEAEYVAKRNECASKIDERTMSAYDRIRKSVKNHLAVVSLYNNNACGGCFNTITPQRIVDIKSGKKLVICEHCGRIIVSGK